MSKPEQQKFYADPDLMEGFQKLLGQQGLNNSEGITRLIRLALTAPDPLVPLLFQQAPGEVAELLARHILKTKAGAGPKVDVPAVDENNEPITEEAPAAREPGRLKTPRKK